MTLDQDTITASDAELLRAYVEQQSEAAFTQVVERHWRAVYSAALRRAGNRTWAEEATQAVFVALSHKSPKLLKRNTILPWLLRVGKYVLIDMQRREIRRQEREHKMATQEEPESPSSIDWDTLKVFLDDFVDTLPAAQRDALTLHFLGGQTYKAIAATTGCGISTIQMRIQAGLKKLRGVYKRKGFIISVAALSSCLSANAMETTASNLGPAISQHALHAATGSAAAQISGQALRLMAWAKAKAIATVCVVAVAAVPTTYYLLPQSKPSATQVVAPALNPQVEIVMPPTAKINQNMTVKVIYRDAPRGTVLRCDLHWGDGKVYRGKLAHNADMHTIEGDGTQTFSLKVLPKPQLAEVFVVAYVCRGDWSNRIAHAQSPSIKVQSE